MAHALLFRLPGHQHYGSCYTAEVGHFINIFEKLRPRISHEQYQSLLEALGNVCERIVDQFLRIDRLICGLCCQIQEGHFDAQYYTIMLEFVNSCTLQHFEQLWTTNAATVPHGFSNTRSKTIKRLSGLVAQCQQIFNNSTPSCSILLEDAGWETNVTEFPLPGLLSNNNTTFARLISHVFCMTWVLVDARKYLRYGTIRILGDLTITAAKNNILDCLQRCFARRPDVYNNVENFKKMLLLSALELGEGIDGTAGNSVSLKADETVRWLLSTGIDTNWAVAPDWVECPRLTLFEWFLLSVPTMCQSSAEENFESRIFLTTRAFIEAGADLGRLVCLGFCSPSSIPLHEVLETVPDKSIDSTGYELEFIVEVSGFQLLDRARMAIQYCVRNKGTALIHDWETLGRDGYSNFHPRVLGIREVLDRREQDCSTRFFPVEPNHSKAITERFVFESSKSPKEWADGGYTFELETIRIVDKIRSQEELAMTFKSWLEIQGYPVADSWTDSWNETIRGIGLEYMDMGSRVYA